MHNTYTCTHDAVCVCVCVCVCKYRAKCEFLPIDDWIEKLTLTHGQTQIYGKYLQKFLPHGGK